jgi:hypothetical protein
MSAAAFDRIMGKAPRVKPEEAMAAKNVRKPKEKPVRRSP